MIRASYLAVTPGTPAFIGAFDAGIDQCTICQLHRSRR